MKCRLHFLYDKIHRICKKLLLFHLLQNSHVQNLLELKAVFYFAQIILSYMPYRK